MLVFMNTRYRLLSFFFFFNDTATTEIYTLSLHDALPIFRGRHGVKTSYQIVTILPTEPSHSSGDRKSTRLNSSHSQISYAVFCLKKKNRFLAVDPVPATLSVSQSFLQLSVNVNIELGHYA